MAIDAPPPARFPNPVAAAPRVSRILDRTLLSPVTWVCASEEDSDGQAALRNRACGPAPDGPGRPLGELALAGG